MKEIGIVLNILISLWLLLMPQFTFGEDKPRHTETTAVLRELYKSEITACRVYSMFAKKAQEEEYGSVERLFRALRKSETAHARNFKRILITLGDTVKNVPSFDIKIGSTKRNLKYALNEELSEIDMSYPEYIKRIKKEGNKEAINDNTYAWKAEQQHRDLIKKMQSAIRFFFGKIVQKLKGADRYFVCQRCGSTLFELPKDTCIICSSPISMYEEVK